MLGLPFLPCRAKLPAMRAGRVREVRQNAHVPAALLSAAAGLALGQRATIGDLRARILEVTNPFTWADPSATRWSERYFAIPPSSCDRDGRRFDLLVDQESFKPETYAQGYGSQGCRIHRRPCDGHPGGSKGFPFWRDVHDCYRPTSKLGGLGLRSLRLHPPPRWDMDRGGASVPIHSDDGSTPPNVR